MSTGSDYVHRDAFQALLRLVTGAVVSAAIVGGVAIAVQQLDETIGSIAR